MYYIQPAFTNVALNTRSTLQVPAYPASMAKVVLDLTANGVAGAITTANISEVNVKIGSRYIVGPIPASVLASVNQYNGGTTSTAKLEINLFDRGAASEAWKEVGALDLPSLNDPVFIEVVNTATTGTPSLNCQVAYAARQIPDAKDPNSQIVQKIKYETLPATGSTKVTWTPRYNGAKIKRVHFRTATANNIQRVEVKRNSTLVHDNITADQNTFNLSTLGKVPQANFYHLDFVSDGIMQNFLDTANAQALEINVYLTTVEPVFAVVELYDVPYNN